MKPTSKKIDRARKLRGSQTDAEGLLWSVLRSKQLCRLKFRRQHPIGPYFADFACVSHSLVVELDGDYHDHIQERDITRQKFLQNAGWTVVRFSNDVVMEDVENVARSVVRQLGLAYEFRRRTSNRSGMMSESAADGVEQDSESR